MRRRISRKRKSESGSALIAALCLIFIAGMLTASVLILSQISTSDVSAHTELQRSAYINEGVANRVQWLLAAEQNLFTDRRLGELDYAEYDYDRYMADGITHEMDYHGTKVQFTITDARAGWDFSARNYRETLQLLGTPIDTETETLDLLDVLSARITDYYDTDDEIGIDGMEADDYEAENMSPLPRNSSNNVLREEFFYIKDFTALFPPDKFGRLSAVRLIRGPGGTPNFFTASPLQLKIYCNLEDEQIEEVIAARNIWFKERTLIRDQLDPLLYASLFRLSWRESGTYTVMVGPQEKAERPSRRLVFTFERFDVTGASDNNVKFIEWMQF